MLPPDAIKKFVGRGRRQVVTFSDETRVTYGHVRQLFGADVAIRPLRHRIEGDRRYIREVEITTLRSR